MLCGTTGSCQSDATCEIDCKALLVTSLTYVNSAITSIETFDYLMGTLKPHSNRPLYSSTVTGTMAVDGCAVTFGTARRGLVGLRPRPVPSSLYQM